MKFINALQTSPLRTNQQLASLHLDKIYTLYEFLYLLTAADRV